jgi:predicted nucleic acid-binding protein
MRVLVDSNVLLDIVTEDPTWFQWSSDTLAHYADCGSLAINPIIYAELCAGFTAIEAVDALLPGSFFHRLELPYEAGFLAAQCFVMYRRRGGTRRSPLPDFYIGAHAAVLGIPLVTRDKARYQSYFPKLTIVAP